jgi:pimeloyl-ACP methyl ester carboxylesterase
MQRRALELQLAGDDAAELEDPLEANPDALEQLATPALVLVGEHDMPDFHAAAELLARQLRARHEVIPGARHLAPLEQPDRFRELLVSFLSLG